MPNTVHFVLQTDESAEQPTHLLLAANITAHYANQGLKLYIQARDAKMVAELDDYLFALPLEQFTPHAQAQFSPRYGSTVLVGTAPPNNFVPILINLAANAPANSVKCRHIIDLVPSDSELKQQARARYRQYQHQGLQPSTSPESELPSFN